MQPPPRKVKSTVALKNTHTEQINKLQAKHQLEFDLLEDIRAFSKQRSLIEKEYAQALLKLSTQYMAKKFPVTSDTVMEDGKEYKILTAVWKTVLEETELLAKCRSQAADTYQQKISESARIMKNLKAQLLKKVMDQITVLHAEIAQTVREMSKAQKLYNDDEKEACDARQKAAEAEDRLQKKNPGIFSSMATLQRNTAKFHSQRESCEAKSMLSRNEYVLTMVAANSHHDRYFQTELPQLLTVLDGDVYQKCQQLFTLLGTTEMDCCQTAIKSMQHVLADANLVSREYNLKCFLHDNPVFTQTVQYEFEAWEHDQVTFISSDHNAGGSLTKEAKKWAAKIAKESKVLRECNKQLQNLQAQSGAKINRQSSASSDSAKLEDPEQRLEDIKNQIRKAETAKLKAEARIEVLRAAGVEVDEWLNSAHADSLAHEDDDISRTSSQMSIRTNSSGGLDDDADVHPESTYISYDDGFMYDTFDDSRTFPDGRQYPCTCIAIYNYQANNSDELDLVADEQLELISGGEGDGWLRARNVNGNVGYVPENYLRILDESENSVDIRSSYSSTDYEVQQMVQQSQPDLSEGCWARSLYDYVGITDDELSFNEGQIIKVLRKDENGIDDGFWEGELNGKVGVFPSLVVEEITEHTQNGHSQGTVAVERVSECVPDHESDQDHSQRETVEKMQFPADISITDDVETQNNTNSDITQIISDRDCIVAESTMEQFEVGILEDDSGPAKSDTYQEDTCSQTLGAVNIEEETINVPAKFCSAEAEEQACDIIQNLNASSGNLQLESNNTSQICGKNLDDNSQVQSDDVNALNGSIQTTADDGNDKKPIPTIRASLTHQSESCVEDADLREQTKL